jgi:CRP/FNR family transcriptional activator FtrB
MRRVPRGLGEHRGGRGGHGADRHQVPQAIERLIVRDANFAHTIVEHLAHRVLAFVGEIEANVLRSGMQRVAAYLDELAAPADGEWIVQLPTTKTLVASRLGMKKETLSRLLRDLSAQRDRPARPRRDRAG